MHNSCSRDTGVLDGKAPGMPWSRGKITDNNTVPDDHREAKFLMYIEVGVISVLHRVLLHLLHFLHDCCPSYIHSRCTEHLTMREPFLTFTHLRVQIHAASPTSIDAVSTFGGAWWYIVLGAQWMMVELCNCCWGGGDGCGNNGACHRGRSSQERGEHTILHSSPQILHKQTKVYQSSEPTHFILRSNVHVQMGWDDSLDLNIAELIKTFISNKPSCFFSKSDIHFPLTVVSNLWSNFKRVKHN